MAKRNRSVTAKTIENRFNEGRGAGRLSDYRPWLNVQDVASQGLATRIKGWKAGRIHHFLSKLETSYFYLLEWAETVVDVREQFPLDQTETRAIAEMLGIKHPTDPFTRQDIVMTADFVITVRAGMGTRDVARTIKYATDLTSERTIEKFEIERRYWQERGVDWGIVTERDVDAVLVENIKWLHPFLDASGIECASPNQINQAAEYMREKVLAENTPLTQICAACDAALNLTHGASLSIVRHLLASRQWVCDLSCPIQPGAPLKEVRIK